MQGIPVIAVKENRTLMSNNLDLLPWRDGQFYRAENYWEAVGIVAALRAGIEPYSVRRPFAPTTLSRHTTTYYDIGPSIGKSSKSAYIKAEA